MPLLRLATRQVLQVGFPRTFPWYPGKIPCSVAKNSLFGRAGNLPPKGRDSSEGENDIVAGGLLFGKFPVNFPVLREFARSFAAP